MASFKRPGNMSFGTDSGNYSDPPPRAGSDALDKAWEEFEKAEIEVDNLIVCYIGFDHPNRTHLTGYHYTGNPRILSKRLREVADQLDQRPEVSLPDRPEGLGPEDPEKEDPHGDRCTSVGPKGERCNLIEGHPSPEHVSPSFPHYTWAGGKG